MKTKIWRTKSGYTIFRVLGSFTNVYLISIDDKNILVDTGKKSSFKKLKVGLNHLLPHGNRISHLIVTHLHYDHCQNAARLKEELGCKIVMSKSEEEFAKKGFTPIPKGTFFVTRMISSIGKRIGQRGLGFEPFGPDVTVDGEKDLLEQGLNIRIIETPGHSIGSISIIVDDEIALVGDAMFGVFKNSIFPPFADDVDEMKNSWKMLLETGCGLYLPGHGKKIDCEFLRNYIKKKRINCLP